MPEKKPLPPVSDGGGADELDLAYEAVLSGERPLSSIVSSPVTPEALYDGKGEPNVVDPELATPPPVELNEEDLQPVGQDFTVEVADESIDFTKPPPLPLFTPEGDVIAPASSLDVKAQQEYNEDQARVIDNDISILQGQSIGRKSGRLLQNFADDYGHVLSDGYITPEDYAAWQRMMTKNHEILAEAEGVGTFDRNVVNAASMLPLIYDSILSGGIGAVVGGAAVGGTLVLGKTFLPMFPEEVVTLPTAVKFAARLGAFEEIRRTVSVLTFFDLVGQGLDQDLAHKAAMATGVVEGIIEMLQISTFTGLGRGMFTKALENRAKQTTRRAASDAAVRMFASTKGQRAWNALKAGGTLYGANLASNVIEEELQELSSLFFEGFAKSYSNRTRGTNFEEITSADVLARMKETFTYTFGAMALLGAPHAAVSTSYSIGQSLRHMPGDKIGGPVRRKKIASMLKSAVDTEIETREFGPMAVVVDKVAEAYEQAGNGSIEEFYQTFDVQNATEAPTSASALKQQVQFTSNTLDAVRSRNAPTRATVTQWRAYLENQQGIGPALQEIGVMESAEAVFGDESVSKETLATLLEGKRLSQQAITLNEIAGDLMDLEEMYSPTLGNFNKMMETEIVQLAKLAERHGFDDPAARGTSPTAIVSRLPQLVRDLDRGYEGDRTYNRDQLVSSFSTELPVIDVGNDRTHRDLALNDFRLDKLPDGLRIPFQAILTSYINQELAVKQLAAGNRYESWLGAINFRLPEHARVNQTAGMTVLAANDFPMRLPDFRLPNEMGALNDAIQSGKGDAVIQALKGVRDGWEREEHLREILEQNPQGTIADYHFDAIPNVFANFAWSVETEADGTRTFVIRESQSDAERTFQKNHRHHTIFGKVLTHIIPGLTTEVAQSADRHQVAQWLQEAGAPHIANWMRDGYRKRSQPTQDDARSDIFALSDQVPVNTFGFSRGLTARGDQLYIRIVENQDPMPARDHYVQADGMDIGDPRYIPYYRTWPKRVLAQAMQMAGNMGATRIAWPMGDQFETLSPAGGSVVYDRKFPKAFNELKKELARPENLGPVARTMSLNRGVPIEMEGPNGKSWLKVGYSFDIPAEFQDRHVRLRALLQAEPGLQRAPGSHLVKGFYERLSGTRGVINLMRAADITTFIHELSHHAAFVLSERDRRNIAGWLGEVGPDGQAIADPEMWSTESHEAFARTIEYVFRTGEIPVQAKIDGDAIDADTFMDAFDVINQTFRIVYSEVHNSAIRSPNPWMQDFFIAMFGGDAVEIREAMDRVDQSRQASSAQTKEAQRRAKERARQRKQEKRVNRGIKRRLAVLRRERRRAGMDDPLHGAGTLPAPRIAKLTDRLRSLTFKDGENRTAFMNNLKKIEKMERDFHNQTFEGIKEELDKRRAELIAIRKKEVKRIENLEERKADIRRLEAHLDELEKQLLTVAQQSADQEFGERTRPQVQGLEGRREKFGDQNLEAEAAASLHRRRERLIKSALRGEEFNLDDEDMTADQRRARIANLTERKEDHQERQRLAERRRGLITGPSLAPEPRVSLNEETMKDGTFEPPVTPEEQAEAVSQESRAALADLEEQIIEDDAHDIAADEMGEEQVLTPMDLEDTMSPEPVITQAAVQEQKQQVAEVQQSEDKAKIAEANRQADKMVKEMQRIGQIGSLHSRALDRWTQIADVERLGGRVSEALRDDAQSLTDDVVKKGGKKIEGKDAAEMVKGHGDAKKKAGEAWRAIRKEKDELLAKAYEKAKPAAAAAVKEVASHTSEPERTPATPPVVVDGPVTTEVTKTIKAKSRNQPGTVGDAQAALAQGMSDAYGAELVDVDWGQQELSVTGKADDKIEIIRRGERKKPTRETDKPTLKKKKGEKAIIARFRGLPKDTMVALQKRQSKIYRVHHDPETGVTTVKVFRQPRTKGVSVDQRDANMIDRVDKAMRDIKKAVDEGLVPYNPEDSPSAQEAKATAEPGPTREHINIPVPEKVEANEANMRDVPTLHDGLNALQSAAVDLLHAYEEKGSQRAKGIIRHFAKVTKLDEQDASQVLAKELLRFSPDYDSAVMPTVQQYMEGIRGEQQITPKAIPQSEQGTYQAFGVLVADVQDDETVFRKRTGADRQGINVLHPAETILAAMADAPEFIRKMLEYRRDGVSDHDLQAYLNQLVRRHPEAKFKTTHVSEDGRTDTTTLYIARDGNMDVGQTSLKKTAPRRITRKEPKEKLLDYVRGRFALEVAEDREETPVSLPQDESLIPIQDQGPRPSEAEIAEVLEDTAPEAIETPAVVEPEVRSGEEVVIDGIRRAQGRQLNPDPTDLFPPNTKILYVPNMDMVIGPGARFVLRAGIMEDRDLKHLMDMPSLVRQVDPEADPDLSPADLEAWKKEQHEKNIRRIPNFELLKAAEVKDMTVSQKAELLGRVMSDAVATKREGARAEPGSPLDFVSYYSQQVIHQGQKVMANVAVLTDGTNIYSIPVEVYDFFTGSGMKFVVSPDNQRRMERGNFHGEAIHPAAFAGRGNKPLALAIVHPGSFQDALRANMAVIEKRKELFYDDKGQRLNQPRREANIDELPYTFPDDAQLVQNELVPHSQLTEAEQQGRGQFPLALGDETGDIRELGSLRRRPEVTTRTVPTGDVIDYEGTVVAVASISDPQFMGLKGMKLKDFEAARGKVKALGKKKGKILFQIDESIHDPHRQAYEDGKPTVRKGGYFGKPTRRYAVEANQLPGVDPNFYDDNATEGRDMDARKGAFDHLRKVIKQAEEIFGVRIKVKRIFGGGTESVSVKGRLIKVYRDNAMHELAAALGRQIVHDMGLTDLEALPREMKLEVWNLGRRKTNNSTMNEAVVMEEGMKELMRQFIMSEEMAEESAPLMKGQISLHLGNPVNEDKLQGIEWLRDRFAELRGMTPREKVQNRVEWNDHNIIERARNRARAVKEYGDEKRKGYSEGSATEGFRTAFVDNFAPLRRIQMKLLSANPGVSFTSQFYEMFRLTRGSGMAAMGAVMWGVRNLTGRRVTDFSGNTAPSFAAIVRPVWAKGHHRQFWTYAIAKHITDDLSPRQRAKALENKEFVMGMQVEDAAEVVREFESDPDGKYGYFQEHHQKLQSFYEGLLTFMVEEGLYTMEEAQLIHSMNKAYVPMGRVLDRMEGKSSALTRAGKLKRFRGTAKSSLPIQDPMKTTLQNISDIYSAAFRRRALHAVADVSSMEGGKQFVELLEENPSVTLRSIELEKIRPELKRLGFEMPEDVFVKAPSVYNVRPNSRIIRNQTGVRMQEKFNPGDKIVVGGQELTVSVVRPGHLITQEVYTGGEMNSASMRVRKELKGRTGALIDVAFSEGRNLDKNEQIFSILRHVDGKEVKEYYKVNDDLMWQSMVNVPEFTDAPFLDDTTVGKLVQWPAKLLRLGATGLNVSFAVTNIVRDTILAAIQSENGFKPFLDSFKGLMAIINKDEVYQEWANSGAGMSALVVQDEVEMKRLLASALKGGNMWTSVLTTPTEGMRLYGHRLSPLEPVRRLVETLENATRVGEFMRAKDKANQMGMDEADAVAYAGYSSREVSLDFRRMGTRTRSWNRVTAFMNASIQGTDKMLRTFKKKGPGPVILSAAYFVMIPSAILWMANHDDEEYQEIPQWEKSLFWHIPISDSIRAAVGMTEGRFIRVPKPWDWAYLFGAPLELGLDWATGTGKHDAHGVLAAFRKEIGSNIAEKATSLIPTFVLPLLEMYANFSMFRGRPLVSHFDQELGDFPELQGSFYTSTLARSIARLSHVAGFPIAAAKWDHLIYGYTGALGREFTQAISLGLEKAGVPRELVAPGTPFASFSRDVPIIRAFISGNPRASADSLNQFYTLKTRLQGAQRVINQRQPELLARLPISAPDFFQMDNNGRMTVTPLARRINKASRYMDRLRQGLRQLMIADLEPSVKGPPMDRLYEKMIYTARWALGDVRIQ
jgi:hypothetical protein